MKKKPNESKMLLAMIEMGSAACAVSVMTERAWNEERDLTRAEAASLREHAGKMLCAALEVERVALGIPAPKRGN